MTTTAYDYFAVFGMVIFGALSVAVIGLGILLFVVKVILNFPRFHVGRPKNPCEWRCYDAGEILTTKDGGTKEPTGRGHLMQELDVKWWVGMSSRNTARWFFGLLRTQPR